MNKSSTILFGALIGAGVWCWYSGNRRGFAIWFIAAMLYHDFVDGQIINDNPDKLVGCDWMVDPKLPQTGSSPYHN